MKAHSGDLTANCSWVCSWF